jgi:hypothetical protein
VDQFLVVLEKRSISNPVQYLPGARTMLSSGFGNVRLLMSSASRRSVSSYALDAVATFSAFRIASLWTGQLFRHAKSVLAGCDKSLEPKKRCYVRCG